MNEHYLSAWLTLALTPRLGAKSLSRLSTLDNIERIVCYESGALEEIGFTQKQIDYIKHIAPREVEKCLKWQDHSTEHHIRTYALSASLKFDIG